MRLRWRVYSRNLDMILSGLFAGNGRPIFVFQHCGKRLYWLT